jgi:nuclear pore complex protein Nup54
MLSPSTNFFPPSSNPVFNFSKQSIQPQQQISPPPVVTLASHPFQYIQQSFDPSSLGYRFRAIFYNLLPVEQQSQITSLEKSPLVSDALWNQALIDNPDPKNCVPIIANGFDDLITRSHWQKETQAAYNNKVEELTQRIQALQTSQSIQGLKRLRERQGKLAERLLRVQAKLEPLKKAGIRLDQSELSLAQRINIAQAKLSENADIGGIAAQLEMLLKDSRIEFTSQLKEKIITDPNVVKELAQLLSTHTEILLKALNNMATINRSLDIINTGYSI